MKKNLRDEAYTLIKLRILDSTYEANEVINEQEIAEELNSSRTPVREAIINLAQQGFLQIFPQRGIFVKPFLYNEVLEIFQVRELVEPWSVKEAIGKLTKDEITRVRGLCEDNKNEMLNNVKPSYPGISINTVPHTLFLEKCNNKLITDLLHHAEELGKRRPFSGVEIDLSRGINDNERIHNIIEIHESHMKLLDYAEAGDVSAAVEEAEKHVIIAKQDYLKFWFNAE